MSNYQIKSHAKINLALNVVGRRKSLHKLESIICFLDLHDKISIKKIRDKNHKIKFIGKFSSRINSKNTISLLLQNLDKKRLLKDKYQIIIRKNIPSKAGLGGGSINAASILKFFYKTKIIRLKKKELFKISNSIGSDTILGFYLKNLILRANNSIKVISSKKKFYTLIVKPNFGCSTKTIYSNVRIFSKPELNSNIQDILDKESLKKRRNDLETIALKKYPKLKILKNFLENVSNAEFVRMTGSGSAVIAYFMSDKKSKDAQKKVKKKFRNYWCITSKTI